MASRNNRLVDIEAQIVHETELAYLLDDGHTTVWIPKSACEDNGDGTFTMSEAYAIDKELF